MFICIKGEKKKGEKRSSWRTTKTKGEKKTKRPSRINLKKGKERKVNSSPNPGEKRVGDTSLDTSYCAHGKKKNKKKKKGESDNLTGSGKEGDGFHVFSFQPAEKKRRDEKKG